MFALWSRDRVRVGLVAFAILAAVVGGGLWLGSTSSIERKAQSLPIGSTVAEAEALLGAPAVRSSGASGTHLLYGRVFLFRRAVIFTVGQWLGRSPSTSFDEWPVYLHFDQQGRLTRIKAGDKLIW